MLIGVVSTIVAIMMALGALGVYSKSEFLATGLLLGALGFACGAVADLMETKRVAV